VIDAGVSVSTGHQPPDAEVRRLVAEAYEQMRRDDVLSAATVWDIARNELPALGYDVRADLERRGAPPT
jgi:hypothetical protein